ncbi:MAG: two-component sensor histidine kinase [Hyphococcus sp.]|nr:MAG: two-component sensor histidine kinase [Marinicaulis sp.]
MLRLFRTTSFRFTLIFVLLFACAVAILGAVVYRASFGAADKQTNMIIDSEITVLADLFAANGPGMLTRVIRQRTAWRDDSIYMLIGAPSGAVLAGNLTALPPEALTAEGGFFDFEFERPMLDAAGRETGIEQRKARGKVIRFRASPEAEQSFLVVVARDVGAREFLRASLGNVFVRISVATIALGVLIGILFSRTLLSRVETVSKTARAISAGDLSRRIPQTGDGDEVDHLSANLNSMLDQIERLMTGMRDVSDNIAHDLRSPLTRIRNRLTDAMKGGPEMKEIALQATLEDSERMLATFNALLSIARIQSGEGAGVMEPIDLVAIAEEMAELYEPAAQDAGFELTLKTAPTPLIKGSRELVSQAIANFLDNALKYAGGGSKIELTVEPGAKDMVRLSVCDDGPGVAYGDRDRIFERFVRLEESRTTPGSGLGLSLVAAIARAHGAILRLEDGFAREASGGNENGLCVVMEFPAASGD